MIKIYQTEETFKFVFYTLGITEEMMNNQEAGKISTKTILKLIEKEIYSRTKNKLLTIKNQPKINLTSDEFFTFCVLIDFTARCFISDLFSARLKNIHENNPFDTKSTFDEMKTFYLRQATEYFNNIKDLFKEEKEINDIIRQATDWEMNDEQFRKD